MNIQNYKPVIGLEVHVELKTKSKMFCGCSADYFGKEPNTHTCPVCLGLPGALPVPNKKAIEWCVMIGLALNCKINLFSKFDRKNYFYPDLPKGYQISQYDEPFARSGSLKLKMKNEKLKIEQEKIIRINRVHMEEDTGKLIHQGDSTLIDFNRSGVPLVEIVTEPDFESAKEVIEYLKKLQQIVRYLDVSNADMEKGEMRLEPNISLRAMSSHPGVATTTIGSQGDSIASLQNDDQLPSYKVEVKNINSFRFVEKAINYEIERQREILESGKVPVQETRGWNEEKQKTVSQRIKEEAMDYRYFPEPDIPPIRFIEYQISNIKYQIGELPDEKSSRFKKQYGLSDYDNEILTREKPTADYFEEAVRVNHKYIKTIANWMINKKIDIDKVLPAHLIQNLLSSVKTTSIDPKALETIIKDVLKQNQKAVLDYQKGKTAVIGFLIGQVKQAVKQPLNTNQAKETIEKLVKTHYDIK